jgi:hypothetical protein
MKTINSISIWSNGQSKEAKILDIHATTVLLNKEAYFWYALYTENMEQIVEGSLLMSGEDYQNWQEDSYAWDWAAAQLNLTIVGEYMPPALPVVEIPEENIPLNEENI